MTTLLLLSPSLRSRIRSAVAIASPSHCVEELVHNAIDAGATHVCVQVDLACLKMRVSDDGRGISKEDLHKVGERYRTSKCHSLKDFQAGIPSLGYRGEALASLVDLAANVQIISRALHDDTTWMASFSKGVRKPVVKFYKQSVSPGTTVCVENFMYNMPVRRQMISATLDLEDIRDSITALALAHLKVSFTVTDESSKNKIVSTSANSTMISAFTALFGKHWNSKNLLEVQAQDKLYALSGVIATEGIPNERKQFLFVNNRLLKKTTLHRIVRSLLQPSIMCRPPLSKYVPNTSQESPSKSTKLYPVFCLQLTCPLKDYDISFEPRKTQVEFEDWDFVTYFLKECLTQFMVDHHLLPPNFMLEKLQEKLTVDLRQLSPNVTGIRVLNDSFYSEPGDRADGDDDDFLESEGSSPEDILDGAGPSRRDVKPGNIKTSHFLDVEGARQSKAVYKNVLSSPDEAGEAGPLPAKRARTEHSEADLRAEGSNVDTPPDGWISKTIPSGKTFYVKLSSGTVVDSLDKCFRPNAAPPPTAAANLDVPPTRRYSAPTSILPVGKTPFMPRRSKVCHSSATVAVTSPVCGHETSYTAQGDSKWLPEELAKAASCDQETSSTVKDILSRWENPNFVFESKPVAVDKGNAKHCLFRESFRFQREMFAGLLVIGQVDLKFIACRVTNGKEAFFVLFDQHAVHERIRLETLLQESYPNESEVESGAVDPPLCFSLTREDAKVLRQFDHKVRKFGVSLSSKVGGAEDCFLASRVPKCFLKRETSELKYRRASPLLELVQELLREITESLRTTRGALTVLPRTLGNLLSSQACRSAVKFGDALSTDQCRTLMRQLERCQAPFQCAHGRPSVAPIVNISKLAECSPDSRYSSFSMVNLHAMIAELE